MPEHSTVALPPPHSPSPLDHYPFHSTIMAATTIEMAIVIEEKVVVGLLKDTIWPLFVQDTIPPELFVFILLLLHAMSSGFSARSRPP